MDIHEYLGVLRRGAVLILIGVLLGLAGGVVAQSMERPTYSATSRELLTNKVAGDLSISQGRIASYVLVASSGLVLQPVIDELDLDTSVGDLAGRINVNAPPNTLIIEISSTASTPEEARDITNTVSRVFAEVVADQLETTTGVTPTVAPPPTPGAADPAPAPSPSMTTLPDGTVVPIAVPTAPVRVVNLEEAALPAAPDPSNGPLMLAVGGLLGLAFGLIAASLREAVDRRVRTPRDVARVTEVPVVGAIVSDRRLRTSPLAARAGSRSASAESFRAVRGHLDHLRDRDGRRIFVFTAAGRGHGTTTTAANVAIAMANTGTSVVLVDADLRRPALSTLFGLQDSAGLSGLLSARAEFDSVLRGSGIPGLTVVPGGAAAVNAGELIATPRMRTVLAELARRFDVVLIDAPTIATASDAAVLGAMTGSTILIAGQGATTRPRLDDALALLEAGGSEPIGIVLTRTRRAMAGRSSPTAPVRAGFALPAGAMVPAEPELVPEPERAPEPAPEHEPERAVERAMPAPSTAVAIRKPEPSHLAEPFPKPGAVTPPARRVAPAASHRATQPPVTSVPVSPAAPAQSEPRTRAERTPRRASRPATSIAAPSPAAPSPAAPSPAAPSNPGAKPVSVPAAKPAVKPAAKPAAKPVPTQAEAAETDKPAHVESSVTEISHTLGAARELDRAIAALPIATAAELRAGNSPTSDATADAKSELIERPIVITPDARRPASRFAPDPTRFTQRLAGAYAKAPAPTPGTEGLVRQPQVSGTVVNTVSIKVQRDVIEAATVPPPIRHILPRPTASTIPPKQIEAARVAESDTAETRGREPQPQFVGANLDSGPEAAQTPVVPVVGSLLGEVGGLPRVEVRAARAAAATDTAPNPEREARESYEQRARDLERAAHDRLMREQQRLAVNIREQLAHDKRELESVLDNRLEDTVLRPVGLAQRAAERFGDPSDDDGQTR